MRRGCQCVHVYAYTMRSKGLPPRRRHLGGCGAGMKVEGGREVLFNVHDVRERREDMLVSLVAKFGMISVSLQKIEDISLQSVRVTYFRLCQLPVCAAPRDTALAL